MSAPKTLEWYDGAWHDEADDGPEPDAIVFCGRLTGWSWWALGTIADADSREAACAAAELHLRSVGR